MAANAGDNDAATGTSAAMSSPAFRSSGPIHLPAASAAPVAASPPTAAESAVVQNTTRAHGHAGAALPRDAPRLQTSASSQDGAVLGAAPMSTTSAAGTTNPLDHAHASPTDPAAPPQSHARLQLGVGYQRRGTQEHPLDGAFAPSTAVTVLPTIAEAPERHRAAVADEPARTTTLGRGLEHLASTRLTRAMTRLPSAKYAAETLAAARERAATREDPIIPMQASPQNPLMNSVFAQTQPVGLTSMTGFPVRTTAARATAAGGGDAGVSRLASVNKGGGPTNAVAPTRSETARGGTTAVAAATTSSAIGVSQSYIRKEAQERPTEPMQISPRGLRVAARSTDDEDERVGKALGNAASSPTVDAHVTRRGASRVKARPTMTLCGLLEVLTNEYILTWHFLVMVICVALGVMFQFGFPRQSFAENPAYLWLYLFGSVLALLYPLSVLEWAFFVVLESFGACSRLVHEMIDFANSGKGYLRFIAVVVMALLLKAVVFRLQFSEESDFYYTRTCASLLLMLASQVVKKIFLKIALRRLYQLKHTKPVHDVLFYAETACNLTAPLPGTIESADAAGDDAGLSVRQILAPTHILNSENFWLKAGYIADHSFQMYDVDGADFYACSVETVEGVEELARLAFERLVTRLNELAMEQSRSRRQADAVTAALNMAASPLGTVRVLMHKVPAVGTLVKHLQSPTADAAHRLRHKPESAPSSDAASAEQDHGALRATRSVPAGLRRPSTNGSSPGVDVAAEPSADAPSRQPTPAAAMLHAVAARADVRPQDVATELTPGAAMDSDVTVPEQPRFSDGSSAQLRKEDLRLCFLDDRDLDAAFRLMDLDGNGTVSRDEFVTCCKLMFNAWHSTRTALASYGGISNAITMLAATIHWFIVFLILLAIYGVTFTNVIVPLGTMIIALGFAVGPMIQRLIDSLLFVLVMAPFDTGDRVSVPTVNGGSPVLVEVINVLTTQFLDATGKRIIVRNVDLTMAPITNLRRSTEASFADRFVVNAGTSVSQLRALEQKAREYVLQHPLDWKPSCSMSLAPRTEGDMIDVTLSLTHHSSWMEGGKVWPAHSAFVLYIMDVMQQLGIAFHAPDRTTFVQFPSLPSAAPAVGARSDVSPRQHMAAGGGVFSAIINSVIAQQSASSAAAYKKLE